MATIRWNRSAFEALRRDPKVTAELKRHADRIAANAGGETEGYIAVSGHGKTRNRAAVITATAEAIRENQDENTLLRALGTSG